MAKLACGVLALLALIALAVSFPVQNDEPPRTVQEEIEEKYGEFKDECFPRPSGGCKCNTESGGTVEFEDDSDCKQPEGSVAAEDDSQSVTNDDDDLEEKRRKRQAENEDDEDEDEEEDEEKRRRKRYDDDNTENIEEEDVVNEEDEEDEEKRMLKKRQAEDDNEEGNEADDEEEEDEEEGRRIRRDQPPVDMETGRPAKVEPVEKESGEGEGQEDQKEEAAENEEKTEPEETKTEEEEADVTEEATSTVPPEGELDEEAKQNKEALNKEIEEKFGDFRENCFPRPKGGCKCNEEDPEGSEVVVTYETNDQCKVMDSSRPGRQRRARERDPVREKAQSNYEKVVQELKQKFKGLRENCFPRPKGCLCRIGYDANGRDITERRMKEDDCKCKEGEVGPECPAAGA